MISKRILQNLNELRQKNKYCDLQLLSQDGHAFSLHKCVFVAACKRQFEIVCSRDELHMVKMSKMVLSDISSEELKLVISFIYGENMHDESSSDLRNALSKLNMLDLLAENSAPKLVDSESQTNSHDIQRTLEIKKESISHEVHEDEVSEECNTHSQMNTFRIKEEPESPDALSVAVEVHVLEKDPQLIPSVNTNLPPPKNCVVSDQNSNASEISNRTPDTESSFTSELSKLKLECEELVSCDHSFDEVKTEEDEEIDKLMDQISEEFELLKSPDPKHGTEGVKNDARLRTENTPEKIIQTITLNPKDYMAGVNAKQLFPRTDISSEQFVPTCTLHTTPGYTNYKRILPKDMSPIKYYVEENKKLRSPQKDSKTRVTPQCKYKMILPRVSCPAEFPALSDLSPAVRSVRNANLPQNLKKLSGKTKDSNTECSSYICNQNVPSQSCFDTSSNTLGTTGIAHRTIATLLALPPLIPKDVHVEKVNPDRSCDIKQKDINRGKNDTSVQLKETSVSKGRSSEISGTNCEDAGINNEGDKSEIDVRMTTGKIMVLPKGESAQLQPEQTVQRIPTHYRQRQTVKMKNYNESMKRKMKEAVEASTESSATFYLNKESFKSTDGIPAKSIQTDPESAHDSLTISAGNTLEENNGLNKEAGELTVDKGTDKTQQIPRKLTLSEQIQLQRNRIRRRKSSKPLKRVASGNFEQTVVVSETFGKSESPLTENPCEYLDTNEESPVDRTNSGNTSTIQDIIQSQNRLDSAHITGATSAQVNVVQPQDHTDKVLAIESQSDKSVTEMASINLEKMNTSKITNQTRNQIENCKQSSSEEADIQARPESEDIMKNVSESSAMFMKRESQNFEDSSCKHDIPVHVPVVMPGFGPVLVENSDHSLPSVRENSAHNFSPSSRACMSVSKNSPEIIKLLTKQVETNKIEVPKYQSKPNPQTEKSEGDFPVLSNILNQIPINRLGMNTVFTHGQTADNVKSTRSITESTRLIIESARSVTESTRPITEPTKVLVSPIQILQTQQTKPFQTESPAGNYDKTSRKRHPMKSQLSVKQLLHIKPKLPENVIINSPDDTVNTRKRHLPLPEGYGLESLKKSKRVAMRVKPRLKLKNCTYSDRRKAASLINGNLNPGYKESDTSKATSSHSSCSLEETEENSDLTSNNHIKAKETTDGAKVKQTECTHTQAIIIIRPSQYSDGALKCYEKPLKFTLEQSETSQTTKFLKPVTLQQGKSGIITTDSSLIKTSPKSLQSVEKSKPSVASIVNKSVTPVPLKPYRWIAPKMPENESPNHRKKCD